MILWLFLCNYFGFIVRTGLKVHIGRVLCIVCVDGRICPPFFTQEKPCIRGRCGHGCGCIKWVCLSKVEVYVIIRSSENIRGGCGHEWVWLPEVGDLLLSRSKDTWLSESSVRPAMEEHGRHSKRKQMIISQGSITTKHICMHQTTRTNNVVWDTIMILERYKEDVYTSS